MLNVINGGMHADNNIDIQEFMLVPHGFDSFRDGLRAGAEIYQTLKKILKSKKLSTSIGDEGGFAPNLGSNREALEFLVQAIGDTGYKPGKQVSIALDCAASSYYKDDHYFIHELGDIDFTKLMNYYITLCKDFPIYSIEDPFDEADEKAWITFTKEKGATLPIVGDDIFVTNPKRLAHGIKNKSANAILIKVNQIGTLSETISTIQMANDAHFGFIISHRSGETEDSFIADLAVAMGGGHIKTGAPCRSERLAKYNQLLRIEESLGSQAVYGKKLG
jgi:enolase